MPVLGNRMGCLTRSATEAVFCLARGFLGLTITISLSRKMGRITRLGDWMGRVRKPTSMEPFSSFSVTL